MRNILEGLLLVAVSITAMTIAAPLGYGYSIAKAVAMSGFMWRRMLIIFMSWAEINPIW
ncbi:hypothetical protein ACF3N7_05420 [Cruoricaptor ignavus]|uniref:hypothetical protein n=1 Tax=Cruoricaptor ignavus TaxID=1118202 RepID=UPI00370DD9A9